MAGRQRVFERQFPYVEQLYKQEQIGRLFSDMLRYVFNAPGGGQLHIVRLIGAEGEIGLRANQPGDPADLRAIQVQINALIHKGQATIDSNERRDIAFQVSDLYAKNVMGIIPVTRTRGTLIARDNVGGMNHPDMGFPLGSGRPRFLWLKA